MFDGEDRIRSDHPLRDMKRRVDRVLAGMSAAFTAAYSRLGRPGVPPEPLLKALRLMALSSVRSERQLCERIDTDLLFRWVLDRQPSDDAFDATTFTHNRPRLDDHGLTRTFFDAVAAEALTAGVCSDRSGVDGTLIESFASAESFRPNDAPAAGPKDANGFRPSNPDVDFHGQKRTNDAHQSRTDPEARLHRKGLGKEARLARMGHTLAENRHGLVGAIAATGANGTAERVAALEMLDGLKDTHGLRPTTLGADEGFDGGELFRALEGRPIEPHVPRVQGPRDPKVAAYKKQVPGVEARPRVKARMGPEGYRLSPECRKRIEEGFGWLKPVAGLGRSRVVGRWKLQPLLEIGAAAYNVVRLRQLGPV